MSFFLFQKIYKNQKKNFPKKKKKKRKKKSPQPPKKKKKNAKGYKKE